MNRRSSHQLRERKSLSLERARNSSPNSSDKTKRSKSAHYERNRKRKYRDSLKPKECVKRGRKETISIKNMSAEDKKLYNREAQRVSRANKKLNEKENDPNNVFVNDNDLVNVDSDSENDVSNSDIDFSHDSSHSATAAAILNIIRSSPKKRITQKVLLEQVKSYMGSHFSAPQMLDILLVLAHSLPQNVKDLVKEKGIEINSIPKKIETGDIFRRHKVK